MITINDIRAAQSRIGHHGRVTPLLSSPFLDEIAGRRLWIKAECLQHTGSFKFRGAWSAISALSPARRKQGVIAFSSGNHAQGVAYAARAHQVSAVIVMPHDAPEVKIANTRALGAEVILYERGREHREEVAAQANKDNQRILIKPYDDPAVIAGQGTCGLELAQQAKAQNITRCDVLVCCGGGGLTSGIALALEADAPGLRVCPVEPAGFDDVARSLQSGKRETNAQESGSICDAIITPSPGEITFPILKRLCGPGRVVTEEQCLWAMRQAFLRLRIVIEPGGAAALAAALFHGDQIEGDDLIVVATGGNTDQSLFIKALATTQEY